MNINSKQFGLSVAVAAAFLWSFYSLENLVSDILVFVMVDETLINFNWADQANDYLGQMILITFVTGTLGWLVAEIYNDFNDMFSLKLK